MTDATQAPLRPLADTSASAVVAGFIAMMTGYTSSLVLMFQAGQAAGFDHRADFFVDLGDFHRHGGVQHRPVPALSHPITIAWSTLARRC